MSAWPSRVLFFGLGSLFGTALAQMIAVGGVLLADWWAERVARS